MSADPLVIEQTLSGKELQLYRDHRDAPAAHHIVLRDRGAVCYVVLRVVKRNKRQWPSSCRPAVPRCFAG
jgi:hypothetical protein